MSVGRCGICGAPTLTGAICREHASRLSDALHAVPSAHGLLEDGPAKDGESIRGSAGPGMPISPAVMDARRALSAALHGAVRVICPGVPKLASVDAAALLRAHHARLRQSYAAPVLLAELEPVLAEVQTAVRKPRGRTSLPGQCRECGPSNFDHVGGMCLVCWRCGEKHTVGEVRRAG